MKRVFRNSGEVAHIWAQQNQDEGRCCNMYFNGAVLYSYGSHYPLGIFLKHGKKQAVLINNQGYSVTTSKHISEAMGAVSHHTRFYTGGAKTAIYGTDTAQHFVSFVNGYCDAKTLGARVSGLIVRAGNNHLENMGSEHNLRRRPATINALHVAFLNNVAGVVRALQFVKAPLSPKARGLIKRIENLAALGEDDAKQHRAKMQAANEKRKAEIARKEAEARKIREAELALAIPAWLSGANELEHEGKTAYNIGSFIQRYATETYMRVEGDEVVTSRGARFPLEHGLKALPVIRAIVARGETWQRNGKTIHLGHYQIDRIEAGQIVAGCHTLPVSEVERLAASLGV